MIHIFDAPEAETEETTETEESTDSEETAETEEVATEEVTETTEEDTADFVKINGESQLAVNDFTNTLHTEINAPLAAWLAAENRQEGDIDFTIVTSPNNPTGNVIGFSFIKRMCEASDALVMVDEAYFEFSRYTARILLDDYENLVILRTFSKAFSLAGVRVGYLLGNERVLREFKKVRQPYSVDAVSQAIARVVYENRTQFEKGIDQIISERGRVFDALSAMEDVEPFPSESNYILLRLAADIVASDIWRALLDRGILIRDFSHSKRLENCLRVSIGTPEENTRFLAELEDILKNR
jgi:histidinol-phosphate aminotransferase